MGDPTKRRATYEDLLERDTPAVRIIDFGVIHWSDGPEKERDQGFQGTVRYAAPEQIKERPVSAAMGRYALGVVLFEFLMGGLPCNDGTKRR